MIFQGQGVDVLIRMSPESMGEEVDFKSRIDFTLAYQINAAY